MRETDCEGKNALRPVRARIDTGTSHKDVRRFLTLVLTVSAALVLSACQATVYMPDGEISGMQTDDIPRLLDLRITPVPPPVAPAYRPISGCTFTYTQHSLDARVKKQTLLVSVKPVRNWLLVTTTVDGRISTALIGKRGKLYDFDLSSKSYSEKLTPRSYRRLVERKLARTRKAHPNLSGLHVINDISLMFPHYAAPPWVIGESVARLVDETGHVWAHVEYWGMTRYEYNSAMVLKFTRTRRWGESYGPIVVGFSLVATRTEMPLFLVLDSGLRLRIKQTACWRDVLVKDSEKQ